MPKQLRLEEMIDCLREMDETDLANHFARKLEQLGTAMANIIGESLDVGNGPAKCEPEGFAGCCAPFFPATPGQKCPEPLAHYDEAEWED